MAKNTLLPALDGFEAECDRQMALARSRRPEEVDALAPLDELELRQGHHPVAVQARLEAEVVARERLDRRQPRCLQRHLDAPALARRVLLAEQRLDRLQCTDLALLDARQRHLQCLQRTWHLQAHQVTADAVGRRGIAGAHRATPSCCAMHARRRRSGRVSTR